MHFVILGCGRVGSLLARRVDAEGHSVAVIDQDPDAFERLGDDFRGSTVVGIGFDRDTLDRARLREAAGFAAVSSGDNTNIIAARIAREQYEVRHVVARIYDPRRAEVYERLGIATVATVRWTTAQVMSRLLPGRPNREYQDVSGLVTMVSIAPEPSWVGVPVAELERRTGARLVHLTRDGEGRLPTADSRVQDGDLLHVAAATEDLSRVESMLSHPREDQAEETL
ncbi:TrkA family potassium uptake protein [Brachybacterium sp. EF45031]|uniref:potassium channel family protein n=1 Tax=Brachybacterium sillae TaxID=2810536 RepID=UPI00217DAAAC|nr:TrkA family potassium uptake protein [Brachybacterium sillae]MCS6710519.1 TrkA family potassium uptake protein [Brachybacterium sillae]